jgi:hypothetical protein
VRRRVKRLLEHAGKMVRAQLYQLGQRRQGDVLGKVFVDVLHQLLLLPFRKPADALPGIAAELVRLRGSGRRQGADPESSTLCQERRTASLIVLQRRSL